MATQSKQPPAAQTSPGYLVPFITVTALFFIFGFITNLNMALVPHLRSIFDSALRVGHAGRVGVLPGLLCLLVADLQAD